LRSPAFPLEFFLRQRGFSFFQWTNPRWAFAPSPPPFCFLTTDYRHFTFFPPPVNPEFACLISPLVATVRTCPGESISSPLGRLLQPAGSLSNKHLSFVVAPFPTLYLAGRPLLTPAPLSCPPPIVLWSSNPPSHKIECWK